MIEYIFLGIFGLGLLTSSFIYLSVVGTKLLYAEKLKELHQDKGEIIKIMKARLLNLELEGKKEDDEFKTLTILLNDLIKIK
jgi:hypothetical protein